MILTASFTYAQKGQESSVELDKFNYTQNGLNPKDVRVQVKNMKQEQIVEKVEAWVDKKYGKDNRSVGDNDDTGKGKKSKKIKVKGFTHNVICTDYDNIRDCKDVDYEVEISVEDGHYVFKPKKISFRKTTAKKKDNIDLKKSKFHDSKDKVKPEYRKVPSQIEDLFNKLNKSLYNFINNIKQEDEW